MVRLRIAWLSSDAVTSLLYLGALSVLAFACNGTPRDRDVAQSLHEETTKVSCERVVSLAPSITEMLFALDLGDRVAGVTRYCEYPAAARKKPYVGGYVDPDIEAISALNPTVVLLLSEHELPAQQLAAIGIPTVKLDHHGVSGIYASLGRIGEICGVSESAARLRARLEQRVAAVRAVTRVGAPVRVLITLGRNMGGGGISDVFAAGKGIFYDDLIRMAGGINAYSGSVPVPRVSQEGILQMNPEVIVDMVPRNQKDESLSTEAVRAEWSSLPVSAVKTGRVYVMEESYAVVPGPRFVETLEALSRILREKDSIQ